MNEYQLGRREFVKLMLSMPAALSIVVEPGEVLAKFIKGEPSPEESLIKLINLFGPWTQPGKGKAEDFTSRFLKNASGPYIQESGETVKSLAKLFSSETMSIESIRLQNLPLEEKKLLIRLLGQLYNFIEVRFDVSNEPPWGECQADRLRYTRNPH